MTNWERAFGTPERAAMTLALMCEGMATCTRCPMQDAITNFCAGEKESAGDVLEWLESEACDD